MKVNDMTDTEIGYEGVEPEIIGKERDNYGRKVKNKTTNLQTHSSSRGLKGQRNESDLNSLEMNSTKVLETVKDHLETAIGHAYFEMSQISNEKVEEDRWEVKVEVDYLFRDKTAIKKFVVRKGVITSVKTISSEQE